MSKALVYPLYVENYADVANTSVEVFSFSVTLSDDNDAPLPNLTGAFSIFNVKQSYTATDTLVSVSTLTNNIDIAANTGVVTLSLTSNDLSSIPTNREELEYVYDWDLIDSTGKFYRILKGSITFAGDI